MFKAAYGSLWDYELVETEDFDEAWAAFTSRFQAVNVTMPFKAQAAEKADIRSEEVELAGTANVLVKTENGIKAYNTDFLAVKAILERILSESDPSANPSVTVVGFGGAGRAAAAAAKACVRDVRVLHHDDIVDGVESDIVIYTLPKAVPGTERIKAKVIVEANYRDPSFSTEALRLSGTEYVPGTQWLELQAEFGFPLMTGMDIPKKFHNLQCESPKGDR